MTAPQAFRLPEILRESPVRIVFGPGRLDEIGQLARSEGASRVLLVTDQGIVRAGHAERAIIALRDAGIAVTVFDGASENPTTKHVDAGVAIAKPADVDFIVGLGGGSAMDCAKGINLILSNGGTIRDYWGINKAVRPMLPMILITTTAGTGSEAQSFALISDPVSHQKMACGDRRLPAQGGLRPRVAILDPDLMRTASRGVMAAAGIDAIAHAVETVGTTDRNPASREMSRQAWMLMEPAFERVLNRPDDSSARSDMLLGSHLAGAAIERSMLGAAHACANPLTARCGIVHGVAVGVLLPHVVRFNSGPGFMPYDDLDYDPDRLAARLTRLLEMAALPTNLTDCGVIEPMLPDLAGEATEQWTVQFNPRRVGREELLEIYRAAL